MYNYIYIYKFFLGPYVQLYLFRPEGSASASAEWPSQKLQVLICKEVHVHEDRIRGQENRQPQAANHWKKRL
jgi:hypothetical protein